MRMLHQNFFQPIVWMFSVHPAFPRKNVTNIIFLLPFAAYLLNIWDLSNKRFKDKTQQGKIEFINNLMIAVHTVRIPNSDSDFNWTLRLVLRNFSIEISNRVSEP